MCWLTATNPRVHELIRAHLHESPMYSGQIHGTGPRYCPSVEDKVVKFADKNEHTIFLEPDGFDSEEIYINGLSTSLPEGVQRAILEEIPGLTRARMLRPGYAVEYDFVFPQQLSSTLEALEVPRPLPRRARSTEPRDTRRRRPRACSPASTRRLSVRAEAPFVLERSEAYAAVMVDDLTQKGVEEPYRLFTSRAEYRLLLGVDTVLPRLLPHGRRLGLIDEAEYRRGHAGRGTAPAGEEALRRRVFNPSARNRVLLREELGIEIEAPVSAFKLLQRNDLDAIRLAGVLPELFEGLSAEQVSYLESRVRYEGYIRRELERLERLKPFETRPDPGRVRVRGDPGALAGGRREVRAQEAADRRRGLANPGGHAGRRRDNLGACHPGRGTSPRSPLKPSRRFSEPLSPASA